MTTEIMPQFIEDMTDEKIMEDVSHKLGISSYDDDDFLGDDSGESGYGSPRRDSRDLTDVDEHHDISIDTEQNVDLFFTQPEDLAMVYPNIEYHFMEEVDSDDVFETPIEQDLVPMVIESQVAKISEISEISAISTIAENAEDNWKNVPKSEVEKVVDYLLTDAPEKFPIQKITDDFLSETDSEVSEKSDESEGSNETTNQTELSKDKKDMSDYEKMEWIYPVIGETASEEETFEILYRNTTPDHHKYKPLFTECDHENGRACHDQLCTSSCKNKKCKLKCHQVVRCWRRREQNKRNSTGFQKRNNLHVKTLQKQKKELKLDLEQNKKLNRKLKDDISLLKKQLMEIKNSKTSKSVA